MEQPRAGVTISDVARRAGVSIATVSRAVNGRYGVAPATIAKVQAVIEELGYESSLVARSLRSARTGVIGIITSDFEPFTAELIKGAAQALRGSGLDLIIYSGGAESGADAHGWEQRHLTRLSGTLTDGTILVTPWVTKVVSPTPVVAIDPKAGASDIPSVASDNVSGAVAAVDHLLELGHRRIALVAGRPDLESARAREQGYRTALERAGVPIDPHLIGEGEYNPDVAEKTVRRLLALPDPPTAIFAANDLSAIRAIEVARDLGLTVPEDLSVVGFDDIPEAARTTPPLTTIAQPIQQMGAEAVTLVRRLIAEPHPSAGADHDPVHLILPTHLVVRGSTTTPRAAGS